MLLYVARNLFEDNCKGAKNKTNNNYKKNDFRFSELWSNIGSQTAGEFE